MSSFALLLFIASITAVFADVSVSHLGYCDFDGFYTCSLPALYNFEEPSPDSRTDAILEIENPFAGLYGAYADYPYVLINGDMSLQFLPAPGVFGHMNLGVSYPSYYMADAGSAFYVEIKGTAPDRRLVVTWENFLRLGEPDPVGTAQMKLFENGNIEMHIKKCVLTGVDFMLAGIQYSGYDSNNEWYNYNNFPYFGYYNTDLSGTAIGWYVSPPAPNTCGNGQLDDGEDCDGGACCSGVCTFEPSTTVCRDAGEFCDVPESCTGTDSDCPNDEFKASGTPCEEDFGVCDVKVARTCNGDSPFCSGFPIPDVSGSDIHWLAYNVISFNNFNGDTGAVGGRLAVKGDVKVTGGFSVADEVVISQVFFAPIELDSTDFSFLAGGSVNWTDGQIYPAPESSIRTEFGYAGGSFTGSDGLRSRFLVTDGGNLDAEFDAAKDHYIAISQSLHNEEPNTVVETYWSGLFISCLDLSGRYVVELDAAQFSEATWYVVDDATCPFGSTWIINVGGDEMTFQGGDFPGVGERVVYNIVGSGRTVNINSGVNANILSPTNTIVQNGGVTRALVIAEDITFWRSGVNPSCQDLQKFTMVMNVLEASIQGATEITVGTFNVAHAGDSFVHDGTTYTITGRYSRDESLSITINKPLQSAVNAGSFLSITIDPMQPRGADTINIQNSPPAANSASMLAFGLLFTLAAIMF